MNRASPVNRGNPTASKTPANASGAAPHPRPPHGLLSRLRARRITLRARLTLVYGGLFLAAGLVLLGVTYGLFNQQLDQGGETFRSNTTETEDGAPGSAPSDPPGKSARQSVTGPDGRTYRDAAADKFVRETQNQVHDAATASLITQGGIALLIVGSAAAGFGWLIAGRVLAPLHQVTDTARRIAAAPAAYRSLHERIVLRGPDDEVKDLADTFDAMIEKLDRSFDGQRRFVANASHELRTPLTLSRALVEMAMHRKAASDDVRQLGENLLEINTRHERLIAGLLLLAGSENDIPERHPVDLADVTAHVITQTAPEAQKAGITVTTDPDPGPAPTRGDVLLLERLIQNLVENGIRHNTGHTGWVHVSTRTNARDNVAVEVSNTGPRVPPYEIPALFEPFRRLGTERLVTAQGVGLGLSIVRAVAHAHDGTVAAHPRSDGGLVVTVTLPLGPEEAQMTAV